MKFISMKLHLLVQFPVSSSNNKYKTSEERQKMNGLIITLAKFLIVQPKSLTYLQVRSGM